MVFLRRLLVLMALVGAGCAAYVVWRREQSPAGADSPPEWPPFPVPTAPPNTVRAWVEPTDGTCPATHPIKLNENSGIFHVPDGRFYDRTKADRCYASADDAMADGYRQAKA